MPDLFGEPDITLADMIREVEAEITMRHRVYGNQVALGRLKQAIADRKIAIMEAVLAKLRAEEKANAGR